MNISLAKVSVENRHAVMPQLKPFIEKMAKHTLGRQNGADIAIDMMQPTRQLWVLHETDSLNIVGYIVTRIDEHAQARHLVLVNCGGKRGTLDAVFNQFFGIIEDFARANGCDGIEFLGRPGWKPFAKKCDMHVAQYQYFKSLRGAA